MLSHPRLSNARYAAALARVAVVMLALVAVSLLVLNSSRAAFSDTADSTGNSLAAGTVDLVDDDAGSAMFTVSNMAPGDSTTECITVTYSGSIADPAAVRVYSGSYTDSADLGSFLNLTIEEGSGGSFGDCSGFTLENTIELGSTLATFDATQTDYASGAGVWDPSGRHHMASDSSKIRRELGYSELVSRREALRRTITWERAERERDGPTSPRASRWRVAAR